MARLKIAKDAAEATSSDVDADYPAAAAELLVSAASSMLISLIYKPMLAAR